MKAQEINQSFDIVDATLECLTEDIKAAIVKQFIRSQIRDTVRNGPKNGDYDHLLSTVAEKLQRRMTPEGSHAFQEKCMNAGLDCRKPSFGRGQYPVDRLADIITLARVHEDARPSRKSF